MRFRTVVKLTLGLLLTLTVAAPAAAQSTALTSVFGGLNLVAFEDEGGAGFTAGTMIGLGTGKVSVVGEAAFSWYDAFNVTALQGGLAFNVYERGRHAVLVRGVAGVEMCCGNGDTDPYFSFEPGGYYRLGLNEKTHMLFGYGIRTVRFEGQWDVERVLTVAVGFNIGG